MKVFLATLGQTLLLSWRAGGGAAVGRIFFLAVVTVVPFGIGPALNLLALLGPPVRLMQWFAVRKYGICVVVSVSASNPPLQT